jgi:hypothetical protein
MNTIIKRAVKDQNWLTLLEGCADRNSHATIQATPTVRDPTQMRAATRTDDLPHSDDESEVVPKRSPDY